MAEHAASGLGKAVAGRRRLARHEAGRGRLLSPTVSHGLPPTIGMQWCVPRRWPSVCTLEMRQRRGSENPFYPTSPSLSPHSYTGTAHLRPRLPVSLSCQERTCTIPKIFDSLVSVELTHYQYFIIY
jgi:hypothetical protein